MNSLQRLALDQAIHLIDSARDKWMQSVCYHEEPLTESQKCSLEMQVRRDLETAKDWIFAVASAEPEEE